MGIRKLIARFVIFTFVAAASGQQDQHYVVLPQSAGHSVFNLFGKDTRLGSWQPSKADIDGLEGNLSQISALSETGFKSTRHIEHPGTYFRQYIGATVNQSKLIYVNAFCDDPPPPNWKDHLYVVMDGWTCYWQAFYDPATKKFSSLTINGRA